MFALSCCFFIPIPVSSSVLLHLPPSLPLRAVYVQVQRYFRDFNGHTRSGLRFLKKSPRLRVVFVSKNLVSPNPCLLKHLKHKHTEATGRRIKKCRRTEIRERRNKHPKLPNPHKKIKKGYGNEKAFKNGSAAMQVLRGGQYLLVHGRDLHQRQFQHIPRTIQGVVQGCETGLHRLPAQ